MLPPVYALRQELKDEKQKALRIARMEELEDALLETAAGIVGAAMSFHEVSPNQKDPPPAWVAEYGEEAARQRLAVAKAGWMPSSLMPAAIPLSVRMYVGIQRGRGHKVRLTQNNLNVQISLPAPTSKEHPSGESYPVKEIDP